MAGRRICAGYYRRYDGKVVYVVSLATDTDTGEEAVIWTTYPLADVPKYYTSSKKSFCALVEVSGEKRVKYKRLMNMKISETAITRSDFAKLKKDLQFLDNALKTVLLEY